MLLLAIILAATGYDLVYSGLKKGDQWRRPWQPVADALHGSAVKSGTAPATSSGGPAPGGGGVNFLESAPVGPQFAGATAGAIASTTPTPTAPAEPRRLTY